MKKKKALVLFSCLFVLAILAGACTPQPAAPTEQPADTEVVQPAAQEEAPVIEGGTVNVGVTYDTPSMDHLTSGTVFTAQKLIFDTLVVQGPDGQFYGLLAKSWDVSDDFLTWTFHLRDDVKFHDDTPFNAEAAKWFFDKARDPDGGHAFSSSYAAVEEVLAPDDVTLIFNLKNPWPNLLFTISTEFAGMISPTAYEQYGEDYGTKYAVGAGPFILEEWVPQEKTVVVRNPDYNWGPEFLVNRGAPHIERIVFKYFPEVTTRISELETGGIDILASIPAPDLPRIEGSGDFQLYYMPRWGGALSHIDLNHTKVPLDDLRVRQALNHAINREELATSVYGRFAEAAYGYMAPHWNCGYADPKSISYVYNPEKAKALLADAGWTDTDGDGVVDKDGEKFSMTMYVFPETEWKMSAEMVQNYFAQIGVELELLLLEYASQVDLYKTNENEMAISAWGWGDPDVYNLFFPSSAIPYLNSTHVDDVDDMLDAANTAPTTEERCARWADLEEHLIKDAVWVPVVWLNEATAVNKRVQNYLFTPYVFSFNDVTLVEP